MKAKKLTYILGMIVIILAFVSCGQKSSSTPNSEADGSFDQSPSVLLGSVTIEPSEQERIVMECTAIAESYAHLYKSALKENSPSFYATSTMILSEDDFNAIMNFLSESNVPILTAEVEDNECETLINIEGFLDFWRKIEHGDSAAFVVYSLGRDGSLFYHKYSYEDDRKYCTEASVTWNDDAASVGNLRKEELAFWDYTEKDNFLFERVYAPPWMGNGRGLIHMGPNNDELVEIAKDYIISVGYYANNLFSANWSEDDWEGLNFNDLFEFLYWSKYNAIFEDHLCEFNSEQSCYYIEAAMFESVIGTYFNVPEDILHSRALYSELNGGYPWQTITCSNCVYNGTLAPDVRNYAVNGDGTITIDVDVLCPTHRTDHFFSHRLTVRPLSNGGFQYVSNEITVPAAGDIPLYCPRVDLQQEQ